LDACRLYILRMSLNVGSGGNFILLVCLFDFFQIELDMQFFIELDNKSAKREHSY
jgi:hypothetical protein